MFCDQNLQVNYTVILQSIFTFSAIVVIFTFLFNKKKIKLKR